MTTFIQGFDIATKPYVFIGQCDDCEFSITIRHKGGRDYHSKYHALENSMGRHRTKEHQDPESWGARVMRENDERIRVYRENNPPGVVTF